MTLQELDHALACKKAEYKGARVTIFMFVEAYRDIVKQSMLHLEPHPPLETPAPSFRGIPLIVHTDTRIPELVIHCE